VLLFKSAWTTGKHIGCMDVCSYFI